jgi:UDP-N-acetylmuramate: L-alanyl-gamma-D-glutamyl-meso-diaminopimelate ligase
LGCLFIDETDQVLVGLAENCPDHADKQGYQAHPSTISNGQTILQGEDGKDYPIQVFGEHTLKNLNGARLICEQIGISSTAFYEAIQSFKGAAKRLELVASAENGLFYKDFAHAPSKVKATTEALKNQYPTRKLVACLELHTFSSLNPEFLPQYAGTLDLADEAIIYLSEHAREIKRMDRIEADVVQAYFEHPRLRVIRDASALHDALLSETWGNANLLMMSSGTFDGLDMPELGQEIGMLRV